MKPAEVTGRLDRELPTLLGDRADILAAAEAATASIRPSGKAWVLASVGTVPAARSRGLAATTIAAGLKEVDAAGLSAVLETSAEANVRLYARLGFHVTAEHDPPGGAPHLWVMIGPVAGPSA
jgi:ribosomal protein S18 acetylase RimI-like enzyme